MPTIATTGERSISPTTKPMAPARIAISATGTPPNWFGGGSPNVFSVLALRAEDWTRAFGPLDAADEPMPFDEIPLTTALREGKAAHGTFRVRAASGNSHEVSASAIPIVGTGGSSGAIVFFWPQEPEGQ